MPPVPTAPLPGTVPLHPSPPTGRAVAAGLALLLGGFGGFGATAALAPLSSAAVAPGVVAADSNRKTIQHLDGGIVAEALVTEGDRVNAGQPLLRFDDLDSRLAVTVLEVPSLPSALAPVAAEPKVAAILVAQARILAARRSGLGGREAVTRRRIAQLEAQIAVLEAQRAAALRQRGLIAQEEQAVAEMVSKGYERQSRLLALMCQSAGLDGTVGDHANRIAQAREVIAQAEQEILAAQADFRSSVATDLRDTQAHRSECMEKLTAARLRLARRDLPAPESGIVLNLRAIVPGTVVAAGAPILDLVPADDRMVVDVRVSPTDIDVVHAGLPAKLVLTAYKQRTTAQLDGTVIRVSADALTDARTGQPFYSADIGVDTAGGPLPDGVRLLPGMPVEAMIVTGERTLLGSLHESDPRLCALWVIIPIRRRSRRWPRRR
jgi:HlyD family type I secretion membrane fusion protein